MADERNRKDNGSRDDAPPPPVPDPSIVRLGARMGGPMMFPGFGGGGTRRCSFCNRREESVTHLIVARGTYICDRCVVLAHEAITSAPDGERLLRIKPRTAAPDDRSRVEAEIEHAFETVFGHAPEEERCELVEGGSNLLGAMRELQQRFPARDQMDISVEYVRFLAEDEAEVHFILYFAGGVPMAQIPDTGHAVLSDGVWKVARETWCRLVGRVGVQCPPAP